MNVKEYGMNKKRWAGILAASFLFVTSTWNPSYAITYQDSYEISLGQGIQLKKISQLYDSGVQNINLLTADLNHPDIKLDLLFNPNEIARRAKLSDMVKYEDNVVAAINADFFSMETPSFSIGAMVRDGKQISTPHYKPNQFGTFLIDNNQNPAIEYIKSGVSLYNTTNGITTQASSINKPNGATKGVIIYTSEYRSSTLGVKPNRPNLVEVIVQNGTVIDVRVAQPPTYIPKDGYVIVSDPASGRDLAQRFQVGDNVELKTEISMNYPDTRMAVGGGSILIRNGSPATITKKVSGKSQRSALAITNDNKLMLMTVDGRGMGGAIGMDEKDVQKFLMAQNVKDAIIFDGGGSTEMIVDSKIENRVDTERALINAVAVKNTATKGSPSKVEITPLRSILVQGEKIPLSVKVFDAQNNLMTGRSVNVSASGVSGSYDGRNFTFSTGGKGTLSASSGSASGSVEVEVIGREENDPKRLPSIEGETIALVTETKSNSEDIFLQAMSEALFQQIQNSPSVVFLGNNDLALSSRLTNSMTPTRASMQRAGQTGFLLLDTSGNTLKDQWSSLESALSSDVKNLVLMTNSKVSMTGKTLEVFQKMIHEASKTKNIYLVEKRGTNSSYREGNISRISVKEFNNIEGAGLADIQYLVFKEQDGALHYSFRSVFP